MKRALSTPGIVVAWPTLQALAASIATKAADPVSLFAIDAFAIRWLQTEMAAGGYVCPDCGNLWTTPAKRHACDHAGGWLAAPGQSAVIRAWIDAANAGDVSRNSPAPISAESP